MLLIYAAVPLLFAGSSFFVDGVSPLSMPMTMPVMLSVPRVLLLPSLIQGRALRYTVVVAFPDDSRICWKSEQTFNGLPAIHLSAQSFALVGWGCEPDLDITAPIDPRPDAKDVLATTNA